MNQNIRSVAPQVPSFNTWVYRSDIPTYSSRLNKVLSDSTTSSRLTTYLCSGDKDLVEKAVNILLSKSYQNKLNFSSQTAIFKQGKYQTCNLFDALLHTIIEFTPIEGTEQYQLNIISGSAQNDNLISKVVAILRNSILNPPNDQVIATNPTAITALLQILYRYYKFRNNVTSQLLDNQDKQIQNITTNTPRYILEILSKISKKLPLKDEDNININNNNNNNNNNNEQNVDIRQQQQQQQQQQHTKNIFNQSELNFLLFNNLSQPVLKKLPTGINRMVIEILEMATYTYDNDDSLMACIETLESITKSSSTRGLIDEILMKPIYEPLFETILNSSLNSPISVDSGMIDQTPSVSTPNNNNNNSTNATASTTPTQVDFNDTSNTSQLQITSPSSASSSSSPILAVTPSSLSTTIQLKQSPVTFTYRNIVERLVELLGHSNNDIQLLSLNLLHNLSKCSQKSRIMICNVRGLVRHLCNLLSYKPGDHMMEMGKKSANVLSYFSKESLNLPQLSQFESMLSQIALTDNPHTDIITNILIKIENAR